MSETLTEVIDPAVLCKPAPPSTDDISDSGARLNSQAVSWNFSCNLNQLYRLFNPPNNAAFNTMNELGANLDFPPTEGPTSLCLHSSTPIDWSTINLEPMADASPQQISYISSLSLPIEDCAPSNDGKVPVAGTSRPTLPTQVSGPSPTRDVPHDPQSKANAKKRGRKRKNPLSPEAEQLRREKFLKRNRAAASRCRERKKKYIDNVEERMVELQRANIRLWAEKEYLVKEIGSMTEVLLGCGSCVCREHGTRLTKELKAWEEADRGIVDWKGAHDEIEDSDILAEGSSIFSFDEWNSNSSDLSSQGAER
jgi:hypothetical protein